MRPEFGPIVMMLGERREQNKQLLVLELGRDNAGHPASKK